MKTKPWRWTKFRSAIRTLLEDGQTVEEIFALMRRTRRRVAKERGWRASELACTLVRDREEIFAVAERLKRS